MHIQNAAGLSALCKYIHAKSNKYIWVVSTTANKTGFRQLLTNVYVRCREYICVQPNNAFQ